jgi:transposase InsO family protein
LTAQANAKAESFMKTLKGEEVYLQQYRDQEDARTCIQRFIEEVYNRKRLHSSLGYLSPDDFERQRSPNPDAPGEAAP